jgi:hypothetical protein
VIRSQTLFAQSANTNLECPPDKRAGPRC